MPVSRLDVLYRKFLLHKFFTKGWGCPDNIEKLFAFRKKISNRAICYNLVDFDYPITITHREDRSDCHIIGGHLLSPLHRHLPHIVSSDIKFAVFELVLPRKWPKSSYRPLCIQLAGTGDHYFWRRRNIIAKPLLKKGIGSLLLENPYYGLRKPEAQIRSSLHYVSDIFVMGGCLVLECIALLNWCEKVGFGPLGLSGLSMGGHMASLAAASWPKPIVLVPCLSWSTASSVFTEGVMSDSIDWDMLQNQYITNSKYCDNLSKLCRVVDDPFACSLTTDTGNTIDKCDLKTSYVTPYEILNTLRSFSNCPAISYKHTTSVKRLEYFKEGLMLKSLSETTLLMNRRILEMKKRNKEALWFMRGMMDECTHLKNFQVPIETSLIIAVCANSDGYVPRCGISRLEDLWPGATVKYVNAGHVGAYILYQKLFRESIIEAFEKAMKMLPPPSSHLRI